MTYSNGNNIHSNTNYWTGKDISINKNQRLQVTTSDGTSGETESPTWASTTSIFHHFDSKLTNNGQAWEEHNSAPRDKGMQTQA